MKKDEDLLKAEIKDNGPIVTNGFEKFVLGCGLVLLIYFLVMISLNFR